MRESEAARRVATGDRDRGGGLMDELMAVAAALVEIADERDAEARAVEDE